MKTRNASPIPPDAEKCAARFGCSVQRAKELFRQNAAGLAAMADKAERTGKPVNGYSAADLRASAAAYLAASVS